MFIASDNKPWYAKIKDYMTHPEYEYATMNTIAVLEFDMEDENHSKMFLEHVIDGLFWQVGTVSTCALNAG